MSHSLTDTVHTDTPTAYTQSSRGTHSAAPCHVPPTVNAAVYRLLSVLCLLLRCYLPLPSALPSGLRSIASAWPTSCRLAVIYRNS